MTIVRAKLDWRLALGTLFALGTLCLCLGGFVTSARASCGDYVMVGGHGGHVSAAHHGSKDDVASAAGAMADYPRLPCNGPECSRRPAMPDHQPPVVFSTAIQQWGWSFPSVLVAPPQPAGDARSDSSFHTLHHPGSVFRPPRSCA